MIRNNDAGARNARNERNARTSVAREFTQKFMKVSINWWTVDVREADGVRGQVMYAGRKRKQNVKSWQLSAVS